MLLCGNSGAGKSSLAYACARAGWKFISDDASYLVRQGSSRLVVGNSQVVRLRPSAAELFPELKGLSLTPRAAGKPSIEVPTALIPNVTAARIPGSSTSSFSIGIEVDVPELVPFAKELALQWASHSQVDTGQTERYRAAIRELLNARLFELRYRTLSGAIARLEDLIRRGGERW